MFFDVKTIQETLTQPPFGGALIIAIDGGSGSGKTTLGSELSSAMGIQLISLDDFHIEVADELLDKRSPEDNFRDAFDRPAIRAALSRCRDLNSTTVVEGVYSHRPEWAEYMDVKIWIEMSPQDRLHRMKVRQANTASQMRLWQATEDWYVRSFDPAKNADIVLDGTSGLAKVSGGAPDRQDRFGD